MSKRMRLALPLWRRLPCVAVLRRRRRTQPGGGLSRYVVLQRRERVGLFRLVGAKLHSAAPGGRYEHLSSATSQIGVESVHSGEAALYGR